MTLKGHSDAVLSCAFSPDNKKILSSSADKNMIIWDAETGKPEAKLSGHTDKVTQCGYSSDGEWIVSISEDSSVRIWNVRSGKEAGKFVSTTQLTSLAIHPNRLFFAVGDHNGAVYQFELVGVEMEKPILSAKNLGKGSFVICPHCGKEVQIASGYLNTEITCANMNCNRKIRINPFIVQAKSALVHQESMEKKKRWWQR